MTKQDVYGPLYGQKVRVETSRGMFITTDTIAGEELVVVAVKRSDLTLVGGVRKTELQED